MKHIEVFKTNVHKKTTAQTIAKKLVRFQPQFSIYFDLEDCDRVLIIESETTIDANRVIEFLQKHTINCEILN